jgi:hypothetical protein
MKIPSRLFRGAAIVTALFRWGFTGRLWTPGIGHHLITHVWAEAPIATLSGVFWTALLDFEPGVETQVVSDAVLPAFEELWSPVVCVMPLHKLVNFVERRHFVLAVHNGLRNKLAIRECWLDVRGVWILVVNRLSVHDDSSTS